VDESVLPDELSAEELEKIERQREHRREISRNFRERKKAKSAAEAAAKNQEPDAKEPPANPKPAA